MRMVMVEISEFYEFLDIVYNVTVCYMCALFLLFKQRFMCVVE
jgi:hypothetical protein